MNPRDPRLDLVRPEFLGSLSRLCLLLALGHFLCLIPLFLISTQSADLTNYITSITAAGLLLALFGVFAQKASNKRTISFLSVGTLWAQMAGFAYLSNHLDHPAFFLFPILSFVATPMLGRRWAYVVAMASVTLVFGVQWKIAAPMVTVCFLSGGILFSAYVSETIWRGVIRREKRLKELIGELNDKNKTIEQWAASLFEATVQSGDVSLPSAPPYAHFAALTKHVGELQERVRRELSQTLLKDRLNTIGLLASGLAHELNTPLTSLEFLLESAKPHLPEAIHAGMRDETTRMGKITRDFLQFARNETKQEIVDLNEIVRGTLPFLDRFHHFNVAIETKLHPRPLPIDGYPNQIQQVIVNLFNNAADAAKSNGALFSLTTSENSLGDAILNIQDNGSGIPNESIGNIFDPFFTTKDPGKGTGLGLFVVQEIANRHRANIHVESRSGLGTTFTIVFPKTKVVSQRKAA